MNRKVNNKDDLRSMFSSVLNRTKGMVNDVAENIRENQETSRLLSQLSNLERDLNLQIEQLFFSDSFGKGTNPSQKEQFIFRHCQKFRKIAPVNQSEREQLLQRISLIRDTRDKVTQDEIRSLISEIESYKSQLSQNNKRIELKNINEKKHSDVQNALQSALRSQRIVPHNAGRMVDIYSKDSALNSIFSSSVNPIKIRIKNSYYLYPDFILVVNDNKVITDVLSLDEFRMTVTEKQYTGVFDLEKRCYPLSSRIGTDSKIIKQGPEIKHYEHERKDGRPDTRYEDNKVISRSREDLAEIGILIISVQDEKTEIEFSSSQAAEMLKNAVNAYCIKGETTSMAGLRLLDLLISVDDNKNNFEIQDLHERYSQFLDEKNPVCRIVSQMVR